MNFVKSSAYNAFFLQMMIIYMNANYTSEENKAPNEGFYSYR